MSIEINDENVDVDFTKPPVDPETGKPMGKGYLGQRERGLCGEYSAARPVMTKAQCIAAAEKIMADGTGNAGLVVEVKNQKSEGSCVGQASTQGLQVIQARRLGKDRVTLLSAMGTYKQIGRSAGSGAMVDDSMEKLTDVGTIPLDTPENRAKYGDCVMANTGFSTRWPADWKNVAKQFRLGEVLIVRGVEQMLTALVSGHPVVVGRQGHSILYLDVIIRNGKLYVIYVNSWGKWGQAAGDFSYGFGLDTESQIRQSSGWAYAMCSVVERE